jgi:sec-independent protein translocase protein TatA
MGSFSVWHWIIVLAVVLIVFGAGRLPRVMGDLAKGIKSFKAGMKDEESDEATPPAAVTPAPAAPVTPPPVTTTAPGIAPGVVAPPPGSVAPGPTVPGSTVPGSTVAGAAATTAPGNPTDRVA